MWKICSLGNILEISSITWKSYFYLVWNKVSRENYGIKYTPKKLSKRYSSKNSKRHKWCNHRPIINLNIANQWPKWNEPKLLYSEKLSLMKDKSALPNNDLEPFGSRFKVKSSSKKSTKSKNEKIRNITLKMFFVINYLL